MSGRVRMTKNVGKKQLVQPFAKTLASSLVLFSTISACQTSDPPRLVSTEPVTFRGMCDASGAVPLSQNRFAIADDEDNALRIYDAEMGGQPLAIYDLSADIGLYPRPSKKPGKPPKAPPELDIEGGDAAQRHGLLDHLPRPQQLG